MQNFYAVEIVQINWMKKYPLSIFFMFCAWMICAIVSSSPVQAQDKKDYPDKPIKMVVPFVGSKFVTKFKSNSDC